MDENAAEAEAQSEAIDAVRVLVDDHEWSREDVLAMLDSTVFA